MKSKTPAGYETPPIHATVIVYDDRPELGNPMRHVATFQNVPGDWTGKRILENFGIAEHLHVVAQGDRPPQIIQHGRR